MPSITLPRPRRLRRREREALSREPTPVEVWAAAFHWLAVLTPETTIDDWGRCKLCELDVSHGEARKEHVRAHERERAEWKRRSERERKAKASQTLRTVAEEKVTLVRFLGAHPPFWHIAHQMKGGKVAQARCGMQALYESVVDADRGTVDWQAVCGTCREAERG